MKTSEKRLLVLLAFALTLGFGSLAMAEDPITTITGSPDSTVVPVSVNDSLKDLSNNSNQDNVSVPINDSFKANNSNQDNVSVPITDSFKVKSDESNQDNSEDKTQIAVADSFKDLSNNSNQDNSEDKTQVAVDLKLKVKDSFNDSSNNSNQDNTVNSYNDKAKAGDNGIALVDSDDAVITKDAFNGNIGLVAGGSVAATTGATASMNNSNNEDNSINAIADRGAIAINSDGDGDVDVDVTKDSYNNKANNGSAAVYGNNGKAEVSSHNTINSDNTTTTVTVGNVNIEVATSVLEGTVSGASIILPPGAISVTTGSNTMGGVGGINTTGIMVLSQNTGIQSQVQQAVTVQWNTK